MTIVHTCSVDKHSCSYQAFNKLSTNLFSYLYIWVKNKYFYKQYSVVVFSLISQPGLALGKLRDSKRELCQRPNSTRGKREWKFEKATVSKIWLVEPLYNRSYVEDICSFFIVSWLKIFKTVWIASISSSVAIFDN